MARKIPKGGLPTRSNGPAPRTPAAKFKGSSIKDQVGSPCEWR
jgi:hypothetical protein